MATTMFENNGIISLGSISSEQDLQLGNGFYINPPPQDGTCTCCGRHISELKPFGKAGDPLIGDFDGDGYDSFVIRSTWGYGIIGGRTGDARLRTQTIRQTNCGGSDDRACHGGLFGSWLARETDVPAQILADGSGADLLIMTTYF